MEYSHTVCHPGKLLVKGHTSCPVQLLSSQSKYSHTVCHPGKLLVKGHTSCPVQLLSSQSKYSHTVCHPGKLLVKGHTSCPVQLLSSQSTHVTLEVMQWWSWPVVIHSLCSTQLLVNPSRRCSSIKRSQYIDDTILRSMGHLRGANWSSISPLTGPV